MGRRTGQERRKSGVTAQDAGRHLPGGENLLHLLGREGKGKVRLFKPLAGSGR